MENFTYFRTLPIFFFSFCFLQGNLSAQSCANCSDNRFNTFVGALAGINSSLNTTNNVFVGHSSGQRNTGSWNVCVGNLTGQQNQGVGNVFMGYSAGRLNKTGQSNIFIGNAAGDKNSSGSNNAFVGYFVGNSNTIGRNNTFFGAQAGQTNQSGSNNVFIGYQAGFNERSSNKLYISNSNTSAPLIYGDFQNGFARINGMLQVGNRLGINNLSPSYHLDVNGTARANSFFLSSDKRFKKDVQPIKSTLERLQKINGVTYTYQHKTYSNRSFPSETNIGFIAQDIQEVFPELVSQDEEGFYSVNYIGLIPVLVEAFKEQQKEVEHQAIENQELIEKVEQLSATLETLQQQMQQLLQDNKAMLPLNSKYSKVGLKQNYPNPFNERTTIEYHLPKDTRNAQIQITTLEGKEVKTIPVNENGFGTITLENHNLIPGQYFYTLMVNQQVVTSKKMVITRK